MKTETSNALRLSSCLTSVITEQTISEQQPILTFSILLPPYILCYVFRCPEARPCAVYCFGLEFTGYEAPEIDGHSRSQKGRIPSSDQVLDPSHQERRLMYQTGTAIMID